MIGIETNALERMISIDITFSFFLMETYPRNQALGLPLDAHILPSSENICTFLLFALHLTTHLIKKL
jgi:hypothetical protein